MWNSELHLRTHYTTCQGLASNVAEFISRNRFSEVSVSEAHELYDMATAMLNSLRKTEDLWDEIAETPPTHSPNSPRHALLPKTQSDVVYIRGVVDDIIVDIDQYAPHAWNLGTIKISRRVQAEPLAIHRLKPHPRMNSTASRMDPSALRSVIWWTT